MYTVSQKTRHKSFVITSVDAVYSIQPKQHLSQWLLQLADITSLLLIAAALLTDLVVTRIQNWTTRWSENWQDKFCGLTCKGAPEISSKCNIQVSRGTVVRWHPLVSNMYREMEKFTTCMYKISSEIYRWKNFENLSTSAEVMIKIKCLVFLRHSVVMTYIWTEWNWLRVLLSNEHFIYRLWVLSAVHSIINSWCHCSFGLAIIYGSVYIDSSTDSKR